MTARQQLHALLRRDMKSSGPGFLRCREFEQIAWILIGTPYDRDRLQNLLIRNRETDGAFLTDDEEAALLHVLNGGSLDVSLATDNRCVAADHHGGGKSVVREPLPAALEHGVPRV